VKGLLVITAVCCAFVGAAPAGALTRIVVTGKGWGHGVGMSQWGAYGYARHGWSYRQILAHYYPGTTLGHAPADDVRVLLGSGQPSASVGCAGGIRVNDRTGRSYGLDPGTYSVGAGLKLPVAHKRVKVQAGLHHRERYAVVRVRRALRSPVAFDCPSGPLVWDGNAYHGRLVIRSNGRKLSVVNTVPLDAYVQGVVGGEMPHKWNLAALEAQAVAARSYALATLKPNRHFDLFSDTRSQVYGGIAYETPGINFAVRRTAGMIVMWNGHVALTFFFSTSGGRTANVSEVWPRLGDIPYLRSVSDPYDASSPHHSWGPFTFDAARLARRLRVPVGPVQVTHTGDGRVASVRIGSRVISGSTFQAKLGLDSTWFTLGSLSLTADRSAVVYGSKVGLGARVDGEPGVVLQRRRGAAGAWKTLAHVNGIRNVTVEPRGQTLYRLSVGGVNGPVVVVAVAPKLKVRPTGPNVLSGTVSPVSRGVVTVWRAGKIVAHPQIDSHGRFSTLMRLRTGFYRVEVGETARFAPVTASLTVTPRLLALLR
jgi:stage II sporulation protein D